MHVLTTSNPQSTSSCVIELLRPAEWLVDEADPGTCAGSVQDCQGTILEWVA